MRVILFCVLSLALCKAEEGVSMDRLVVWYSIGADTNPETRRLGWGIAHTGSYEGLIKRIEADIEQYGFKRIVLHNPFGTLPKEAMQFDQYVEATKNPKTAEPAHEFAREFHEFSVRHPDLEMIVYLGSIHGDNGDFKELRTKENKAEATLHRIWESVRSVDRVTDSIGMDNLSPAPHGSLAHGVATILRASGMRVYIEARPQHMWQRDYPVIATIWSWRRQDSEHYDDAPGLPTGVLSGEQVLLTVKNKTAKEGIRKKQAHWILSEGHTLAVAPRDLYWAHKLFDNPDE